MLLRENIVFKVKLYGNYGDFEVVTLAQHRAANEVRVAEAASLKGRSKFGFCLFLNFYTQGGTGLQTRPPKVHTRNSRIILYYSDFLVKLISRAKGKVISGFRSIPRVINNCLNLTYYEIYTYME